jgi:hypothetical protein
MIEKWMKLGGLDLGVRGGKFEAHCRTEVQDSIRDSNILKHSGVFLRSYKFKGLAEDPGDIDIVIWIGRTLLIGEIKCNLFPSRGSEKSRHLEEMRTSADQINRKAASFNQLAQSFYQENVDSGYVGELRIIPFILTNLSLGVGMLFEEVPVTDLMILNRYLEIGSFDKFRIVSPDGQMTGGYRVHFYDSEEEAGERIKAYLSDPPQLWHFRDSSKLGTNPIIPLHPDDVHWDLVDYSVEIDGEKVRAQTLEREDLSRFEYRREPL